MWNIIYQRVSQILKDGLNLLHIRKTQATTLSKW